MSRRALSLEQIFDAHLHVLATTLRPHTVRNYRNFCVPQVFPVCSVPLLNE
jgi:hypothetical protein